MEKIIIYFLDDKPDAKIHHAFVMMHNHFIDEDFIHGTNHNALIEMIYLKNYYKSNLVKGLTRTLFLDNKTLIAYRKSYLKLFAKYYLKLSAPSESDFDALHEALVALQSSDEKA